MLAVAVAGRDKDLVEVCGVGSHGNSRSLWDVKMRETVQVKPKA